MSPFNFVRFVDAVRDQNGIVTGRPAFVRRLRRCRNHDTRYVLNAFAFRGERGYWADIPGALLPLKRVA